MAEITITIPDAEIPRVRAAFATLLRKDVADVTVDDVQAFMVQKLKVYVRNVEREAARKTADMNVTDIGAT